MREMKYLASLPKAIPEGQVLVHNFVRPVARRAGTRGSRYWPRHAQLHAELGSVVARDHLQRPPSHEQTERQPAHPFHPGRGVERRDAKRDGADRPADDPHARLDAGGVIVPSAARISGFHPA